MSSKETKNLELYDTLKSRGYEPRALSASDDAANIKNADLFAFSFLKNGQSFGPARVSIDDKNNLVLYTSERLENSPQSKTKGSNYDDSWNGFTNFLKGWSKRHGLTGFKRVSDQYLRSDMRKRNEMKNNKLDEGYHAMGKKLTYSDSIPTVKILLQHTRQIEEGEQRYRNINKIFVENVNGERFLLPTKRPGIAKVYARHIAEGGTPYDERGKHITSLVEEYTKMAGFIRATKNGQFNESTQRLVNEATNYYQNLRETLSHMISMRGYNKYFDSYTPVLNEETDDTNTLNELFVEETLDPRIESVLPILKRLSKKLNEMNEVKALEEWAESITEVEDETDKTLAVPGKDMLDEISIATLKGAEFGASDRIKKFEREIERLKKVGDNANAAKYEKVVNHYKNLLNKTKSHPGKMDTIRAGQKLGGMMPAKFKNVAERVDENIMETGSANYQTNVAGLKKRTPQLVKYIDMADNFIQQLDDEGLANVLSHIGGFSDHPGFYKDGDPFEHAERLARNASVDVTDPKVKEGFNAIQRILIYLYQIHDQKTVSPDGRKYVDDKQGLDVVEDEMDEGKLAKAALLGLAGINEAPGAETLAHNDDTEEKNLKAFGLAEGFSDVEKAADTVMQSMGGTGKLTKNDIRDAVIELQQDMDDPYKLDVEAVVDVVTDRLAEKGMMIADTNEDLDANQKAAGQLGPTEPVGKNEKNLRGKLVGASESVENKELNRIKEMIGYK